MSDKMQALLEAHETLELPKVGETVVGTVVAASRREVRIDIGSRIVGVVRGHELFADSEAYGDLQVGQEVESTVIDLENENGEMELSFKYAGEAKAWETMRANVNTGDAVSIKVLSANKGGLIVKVGHLQGFLPVSQLAPEHYPRVSGGSKQQILEKLREFVGIKLKAKVLDVDENEGKLIMSEKAIWEEEQRNVIAKYKVGEKIEGTVTAVADFGAFVKFPLESKDDTSQLEGLVHISEIAWQRIDHPRDFVKMGDTVKAEIISIEGSKIFLSMKKLAENPWDNVVKKYKVGDVVEGTILKVNPFGFFVELDRDIHGLAHISELDNKPVRDINALGTPGEKKQFMIVSIEPERHRLGLSLKALKKGADKPAETTDAPAEEKKEETPQEAPAETPVAEATDEAQA